MMIKQQEQVFVEENMSNLTSPVSGEASVSSSSNRGEPSSSIYPQQQQQQQYFSHQQQQDQSSLQEQSDQPPAKKKRNLPGNPDPDSEVIALSPKTLLATNRFVCEVCGKGFQRDQNLQLHRRGHNLPWKLKQRSKTEVIRKKVYVCPETSCVHHDPSRALGDLTGIKKHFCRKHGEKKWKCEKCSKRYAVQSDWKAHSKVCGTREYRCDCGTLFSRRDSFITHRAFCDALAEETARGITHPLLTNTISAVPSSTHFLNMQQQQQQQAIQLINSQQQQQHHHQDNPLHAFPLKREQHQHHQNLINLPPWLACPPMDTHHVNHHQQQHHLASPSSSSSSIFHHQDQHQQLMQQQQQSPHYLTDHQQHHHQIQQHQVQHQQNQNPSNPSMGPTYTTSSSGGGGAGGLAGPYHTQAAAAPSAHTSATALLQQAAQMGASMSKTAQQNQGHVSDNNSNTTTATTSTAGLFGLNLSSRDHQQEIMSSSTTSTGLILNHGLSSFGNKAANPTPPPTTIPTTCGGPGSGSGPDYPTPGPGLGPSSSSSFLHDMMVNSLSSSPYDDDAFGIGGMGMLGTSTTTTTGVAATTNKKDMAFHQTHGGRGRDEGGATANGGGNDGLTRDFLGLRPLSHNEILTMAGLGNCMTTSNSTTTSLHQQETHKPWQT